MEYSLTPVENLASKERATITLADRQACEWDTPSPPRVPIPRTKEGDLEKTIRVQFYSHISKIHRKCLPDMEASIDLDEEKRLHISHVSALWGLDSCVPVDRETGRPLYQLVGRGTNGIIEFPWVLKLQHEKLNEEEIFFDNRDVMHKRKVKDTGTIMFIEPSTSKYTSRKRAFRESRMMFFQAIIMLCTLMNDIVKQTLLDSKAGFLKLYHWTPLPLYIRDIKRVYRFTCRWIKASHVWMGTTGKNLAIKYGYAAADYLQDLVTFLITWFKLELAAIYYQCIRALYTVIGIERLLQIGIRGMGIARYQNLASEILTVVATVCVLLVWFLYPMIK
ncbi:hypothetical protein Moror_2682 [Moniliophthora roreri MCA 2997]|uniref:Uncharacterized protein n=1 Tax=Moniliophthora roreri (strain MCA 2997) TaxID=1381753 RepID=V2WX56_MONRO|nr:hypothetical protein Moror_2682 [Moniliophthora roreri MCA 2997]